MTRTIKILKSSDALSLVFTKELMARINEIPDGYFFSMALSGGSTPRKVFEFLVEKYAHKINWKKVRVFWGDERCVPPDDNESNFMMAKASFLTHIPIPESNIFRIKGENDPEREAFEYENIILKNVRIINGIPAFDFFMLGLGTDGHTASIFPDHLELFHSEKLFDITSHPVTHQIRITATGKLINNARFIVFLATGEAKSAVVAKILDKKSEWENLPASLVRPENGALLWLLDEKAASNLLNK